MAKRQPRLNPKARRKDSWRTKLHPFFIRVAEYQKEVSILTRSKSLYDREKATRMTKELPEELTREADRLYDERQAAGTQHHRPLMAVYGAEGLAPGSVLSENDYMYHRLCWFKFNKTLSQLLKEYQAGEFKAAKQLNKLGLEFDKWRFGKIDPNTVTFKTDVDHFGLVSLGLDLGMMSLTTEELADCFDQLCPCGKSHDPENLRKLRTRIDKTFPVTS
jgi:hypothetical protein